MAQDNSGSWAAGIILFLFLLSISGCVTGCLVAESNADKKTTERCIRAGGDHMIWQYKASDLCVSKDGRIIFAS